MKETVVTVAAIIKFENKVLIAQRNISKYDDLSYKWEFPGGKVDKSETKEQALIREIKEELGCDIEIIENFDRHIHEYGFGYCDLTSYICKAKNKAQNLEHYALKCVEINDLHIDDFAAAHKNTILKLKKSQYKGDNYEHESKT